MSLLFFNLVGLFVQNKIFLAMFLEYGKEKNVLWHKLISIVLIIMTGFIPLVDPIVL